MSGVPSDKLWFVRAGESGVFATDFRQGGYVAIGWYELGENTPTHDSATLIKAMEPAYPGEKVGTYQVWAAQIRRYYAEPQIGDGAITYDPKSRLYHLGVLESDVFWRDQPMARGREVTWTHHVKRDDLSEGCKRALGSIATFFLVRDDAAREIWSRAKSNAVDIPPEVRASEKLWSACVRLAEIYGNRPAQLSKDSEQLAMIRQLRTLAGELANQLVPNEHWLVKASVGQGNWVRNPWLAIMDKRVTTTAQEGAYFVLHVVGESPKRLRFGLGVGLTRHGAKAATDSAASIASTIRPEWMIALRNQGFTEQQTPDLELPGAEGVWGMITVRQVFIEEVLEQIEQLNGQVRLLLGAYVDWANEQAARQEADEQSSGDVSVVPERAPAYANPLVPVPDRSWLSSRTLWTSERIDDILEALETRTPQIVLAGPPGTGKTWVAEALATYLTGGRPGACEVVQFHPTYSYEEFIEGLRPVSTSGGLEFRPTDGLLLRIAKNLPDGLTKVLIVDEINRANLPKVFGELMYLLEYRGKPINLQYSNHFALPKTLLIIGTMNTADRSIRSIDTALRRRFEFFDCSPDPDILRRYYDSHHNDVPDLVDGFDKLNDALSSALDRHHTIGHTFLMAPAMTGSLLRKIWKHRLGPLIDEYFFDQPDVAATFDPGRFWSNV